MRNRITQEPIPEHISARPEDLPSLMEGLIGSDARAIRRGFDPVILREIDEYKRVLASCSASLLECCIDWRSTENHNVEVPNDTGDPYRFFDCLPD